uniref:Magnesium transporter n=1 Tax=Leersia perrieri TaxID=77586 RepID=A0A0D9V8B0_9ORYZ
MDRRPQPVAPMPVVAPAAGRRKGAAASRKWLVVPSVGEERRVEFGKHQIMKMTGLPGRDLRVLDPVLAYPSTILGRDRAIVVRLQGVKAIITATEVLVPDHDGVALAPFLSDLRSRLSSPPGNVQSLALGAKTPPFEFTVLELCLEHACKDLESQTESLEKEAYPALDKLGSKVSTLNLDHVRNLKSRMVDLSGRVQKVRDELEHLLDDDMDMSEMYLTRKLSFQGFSGSLSRADSNKYASVDHDDDREEEDHDDETESSVYVKPDIEELEMLLEAYFVQIDGTLNKLYHIREYADDTEDYINIMLDEKQNQLLQMGVMLTTATVVVTAGIVVVSLFGMNIHIELMKEPEDAKEAMMSNIYFWETTLGTVFGCVAIYLLAIFAGKKSKILQ